MRETHDEIVIRGMCECGRRYRILRPRPEIQIPCPHCHIMIRVRPDDYRAAGGVIADEIQEPVYGATAAPAPVSELPWAILIDRGQLELAPAGSKPGLTGEMMHESAESKLYEMMRGSARLDSSYTRDQNRSYGVESWFTPGPKVERTLLQDILASFYLAGSRRNAVLLAISTLVLSLLSFATMLPGIGLNAVTFFLFLLGLIGLVIVTGTILQFFTSVLVTTAEGDDDIPLRDAEWNFVDNVVWPIFSIGMITTACGLPAFLAAWYTPMDADNRALLIGLAAVFGSLFWPIAAMAVLIGDSVTYLRPDWLMRCIVAVGPAYLLAWLAVVFSAGMWVVAWMLFQEMLNAAPIMWWLAPFWLVSVNLYFGYVMFRNVGLVYRHFGDRMKLNFFGRQHKQA